MINAGCMLIKWNSPIERRDVCGKTSDYSLSLSLSQLEKKVEEVLKEDKVDAVICVAGGWAGGNAASKGRC